MTPNPRSHPANDRDPVADGPAQAPSREQRPLAVVNRVVTGWRRALALLAATSLAAGFSEAVLLVIATRVAIALTQDEERIGVTADWSVTVSQALLLALALVAVRLGFALAAAWQQAEVNAGIIARARHRMADAYLESTWEVQQRQESGSLQIVLAGYTSSVGQLANGLTSLVVAAGNLVAMLALTVVVDASGAFVLVGSVIVLSVLLGPLRKAVRNRARETTRLQTVFSTKVSEVSDLGMELHVFDVQSGARRHVDDLIEESRVWLRRLGFSTSIAQPVYVGLAYGALLGAIAVISLSGAENINDLGAVVLIMLRSLGYGQGLQVGYLQLLRQVPFAETYYERLAVYEDGRRSTDGEPVGAVGALEADHVSFEYQAGEPVLRDVSFRIEPREVVGIVGPSGAGKSTLVQLLLGLRAPSHGRVCSAGRDIAGLAPADWARHVTFVPQEPRMISGTIEDNIRFFRDGVSTDEIRRAARLAQVHDEVAAMPHGYDRMLGPTGAQLSGGQKQRLTIARALIERPDVLILDEPTSSLDVRSEDLIRATLVELSRQMTVIIIAHRLSTLNACTRIMVIADGQLHGFDTPERLEQSNEFYRESLVLSGLR